MGGIYSYINHHYPHGRPNDMTTITKAIKTRDAAVPKPSRREPASLVTMLANLEVGECFSKSIEIKPKTSIAHLSDAVRDVTASLTASLGVSISRAKADTGYQFVRETFAVTSPSMRIYVQTVITRTA